MGELVEPSVERSFLELEGGVGEPTEGDRQPEVHRSVGEHARQCLAGSRSEPGDHRDEDEFDDAEAAGGDGDGGQDVGQPVGHQEVDGRDEVAEGGDEDPQGCRIEQPVGRGPANGPTGQGTVLHERAEP